MNKYKKTYKSVISFLLVSQLLFSTFFCIEIKEGSEDLINTEQTYLSNAFNIYNSESYINNKTPVPDKANGKSEIFNDKYFSSALDTEKKTKLLYCLSSEESISNKEATVLEKTNPRSPPLI